MSLYTLAPQPWLVFLDDAGLYLPNAQLAIYAAGTSTPATVYTSATGTAHPFPITLDGAGRVPGGLYLQPGLSYKFVLHAPMLEDPLDGAILRTQDNVEAVPLSGGALLTVAIGGDISALNISGVSLIEYWGGGDVHIHGLVGGVPGQSLAVRNLSQSGGVVWLHHNDGAVPWGNRLQNFVQYGPVPLVNALGTARYTYLSVGVWGMEDYSMGGLITPPFNPADYSGRDGALWSVEAADRYAEGFYIAGALLSYSFYLQNTSLNAPTLVLQRQLPYGWQCGTIASTNLVWTLSGGPSAAGSVIAADSFHVGFLRLPTVDWPVTVNGITLVGQIAIPMA